MCSGISSLGRATRPSGNSGKFRTSSTTIQSRLASVLDGRWPPTALVWFRRDLRVHDHPPLRAALDACERVVPVFVLDDALLHGRHASGSRTQFMLECLHGAARGAAGSAAGTSWSPAASPSASSSKLAKTHDAEAVYFASDASPFAMARDRRVEEALEEPAIEPRRTPGNFVADIGKPKPYAVFTPFWRAWKELPRRDVIGAPRKVPVPSDLTVGAIPSLGALKLHNDVPDPMKGGETRGPRAHARLAARRHRRLRRPARPHRRRHLDALALPALRLRLARASSRRRRAATTPTRASSPGATSTPTSSCTTPTTPTTPTAASSTRSTGTASDEHFDAWREGRTGYPVVDAGMRQLAATGWMHNRARLITACFLVKDLHIDWRRGEQHFMRYLLDGDEANNNGNWQWISSVGVDPAPLHRRLYNPVLQQERHDPKGEYVRRWVPELADVPLEKLATPWEVEAHDEPIVDHAVERRAHARRLRRRPRPRKLPPRWRASRSSPAGRSRSPPPRASSRGWPPGQGPRHRRRGPAALPRRRLERARARRPAPGRRHGPRHRRGRQRGARDRAGRADRLARPRRQRLSGGRRARPDRRRAAARTAATCAPCSSTRPTRPPPGRSSRPAPSTPRR